MRDLRARRRLQTRREVSEVALRLFAERGFDAVTVAEIATEAGISRRSFFTHFSGKEEAVLAGADDDLELLRRALAAKDPATSFVEVLRAHAPDLAVWRDEHRDVLDRRRRIEVENPVVAAKVAGARAEAERELITPHIADELELATDHEMVALVAGAFAGLGEVLMARAPELSPDQVVALAERALVLFQALLDMARQASTPDPGSGNHP